MQSIPHRFHMCCKKPHAIHLIQVLHFLSTMQCSISPGEGAVIGIVGQGIFKILKYLDGTLKSTNPALGKRDPNSIVCQVSPSFAHVIHGASTDTRLGTDGQLGPQVVQIHRRMRCLRPDLQMLATCAAASTSDCWCSHAANWFICIILLCATTQGSQHDGNRFSTAMLHLE